ncbi:hypothetical protein M409DRAFT_54712 [Zasmidium cellare ATCC 36951]|uniref:Uncharacterized protein n=1 Tax=Zasmidium cellare ATCC 36951 TaxID=1080233 RepID=A0A6A6CIT9_ZASCE|nr:uncharacterized protein M409DRAFT_54712 [Zasmidium cellare ATCC 36951]KAF2166951.1 hypothetical protein M409DRAFT_54712 [Zasmidium cellare ATCC 36951]
MPTKNSLSSCLQWPATQTGHWSAAALFYSSILLSLVAIVSGSQQLLLLPREKPQSLFAQSSSTRNLAQQHILEEGLVGDVHAEAEERAYLEKVVEVMCIRRREDRPNNLQVFALQMPLMLLSLAVVMFLAGICSVVFAPLARDLAWNGDAKTAVMFGVVGMFSIVLFYGTSQIVHGMFSRDEHGPWIGSRIARIPT